MTSFAQNTELLLDVQHITMRFGGITAVNDLSMRLPKGSITGLIGPNGAGKSTVIKSIAGLLRYKGGIGIQGMSSKTLEAKKLFAYVPEIPAMFEALTVKEHIEFVRKAYQSTITDAEMQALLKRFEMEDKQDKLGSELSKGMMQKVSILCALAIKPKVILLDEPMVGLDPKAIKELKEVVVELRDQGTTVLISTHMLEMVEGIWDVMFVMEKGKIIGSDAFGKPDCRHRSRYRLLYERTGRR